MNAYPTRICRLFATHFSVLLTLGLTFVSGQESKPTTLAAAKEQHLSALHQAAKPIVDLQTQYANNLANVQKQAESSGDLDAVVAIKSEFELFRSGKSADASNSAQLRRLQPVYRSAMTQRRAEFRGNVKPVLAAYYQSLENVEKAQTAVGNVDEALQARQEKERIKELAATKMARIAIELGILEEGYDPIQKKVEITLIPEQANTDLEIEQLKSDTLVATNRSYNVSGVPAKFEGWNFVKMEIRGNLDYQYILRDKGEVYVMINLDHSDGAELVEDGWASTNEMIQTTGGILEVFSKVHLAGEYFMDSQGPWPYIILNEGPTTFRKK